MGMEAVWGAAIGKQHERYTRIVFISDFFIWIDFH